MDVFPKSELPFLAVVDDLFTHAQCDGFINLFQEGEKEQVEGSLAKYRRVLMFDKVLASNVFDKVKDLIPPRYGVVSVDEVFRFSEYEEGWEFKTHKDGVN